MPLITYVRKDFTPATRRIIAQAVDIVEEYAEQGYDLTLRQLYYQFVARDLISNKQSEYKRLGSIVNDARLAGLIDWDRITDRTRNLQKLSHWSSPAEIISAAAHSYRLDKWAPQRYRIEVWIEKEALAGVFQRVCESLDLPFFSCRGYVSQSEMWAAAQRLIEYEDTGYQTVVLHFGDHDPSGIDMTRDIRDRLELFESIVVVLRLALTMDQVEEYSPPPNPAKITDSRYEAYRDEYGEESWELDALEPQVLADLVSNSAALYRDEEQWSDSVDAETSGRRQLMAAADSWSEIAAELRAS